MHYILKITPQISGTPNLEQLQCERKAEKNLQKFSMINNRQKYKFPKKAIT